MMNFKRLVQPSVTRNDKNVSYSLPSFQRNDAKNLLSQELAGGGVFGIEAYRTSFRENLVFFSPPHYKTNWAIGKRDDVFSELSDKPKNATYIQLYTEKASIFPIGMDETNSFWDVIQNSVPKHISVMYQLLLAYRHDNWQERLQEQYDDYLNGIEQPSDMRMFRKFQRNFNEKLDGILKWEYKHTPIEEVDRKLKENGFRYNIRLALYNGTKNERNKAVQKLKEKLAETSYTNNWCINTPFILGDVIQNIKDRKLDNIGKNQVLSVSEILPFMMSDGVVHIEQPSLQLVKPRSVSKVHDNPFELLPMGDGLKEVNGKQIAEKFIHALKELKDIKGEMVAKHVQSGATLIKTVFDLPKELKFSELTKKNVIDDLQMSMGMKGLNIEQGDNEGEFNVVFPASERQNVFLRNYIDTDEFRQFAKDNPLPFCAGTDEVGNPIFRDLTLAKHLLIAAQTGGGKSTFVNSLILTLLLTKTPEELQFYMVDIKRVELSVYRDFPQVAKVVTDVDESIYLFKQVISEMRRRYELFEKAEVRDIKSYNNKFEGDKLPYIVICIDEYAELSGRNTDIHDYVQTLTQLSRASGITLILVTQDPRKEVLPPIIRSNMPSKIAFRCSNEHSYLTFLSKKPPRLYGNGDGVLCFDSQMEMFIRFQGCLITEGDEIALIKKIAESMREDKIKMELPEVEEVEEVTDLDRLKKIIATTGETRISQLRNELKININKLNDLMKELCAEGWMEAPESRQSGYRLVADDEELNRWRK